MADFYLYADESGKFHNSDYISFCGYLTQIQEWQRICVEWDTCRLAWDVPPIHMAEIMYPDRDKTGEWQAVESRFGKVWKHMRDEMLAEFAGIMRNSLSACVGCSVDAQHFRDMPDTKFKQEMQDPIYLAFYTVVMNSIEAMDRLTPTGSLSIVVDDDQEYSLNCYRVLNGIRNQFPDKVANRVDCICFANDKAYPGIQAADMIAYETRSLLIQKKANPEYDPSSLYLSLTRKLVHQPKLYTPHFLDILNK